MPNAIQWQALPTKVTVCDLGTTLAADTLSSFDSSNEYNNGTNLNMWGWLVLATSTGNLYGTAVTRSHATCDIYVARKFDDTNLENKPAVSGDRSEFSNLLIASIPIATEVGVVPIGTGRPVLLPPFKLQFAIFNNADQQMNNTWQIDLYPANSEVQ